MNSKFLRALIPSEINFAVGDKETALKIEKQKRPKTPSYFFTSVFIQDVLVELTWAGLLSNPLTTPTSVHKTLLQRKNYSICIITNFIFW